MTNKERALAAFEGRPVDRFPVTSFYSFFYVYDHFEELTGLPQWKLPEWLCMSPDEHMAIFRQVYDVVPFELLQPSGVCHVRAWRERQEFILRDGKPFRHDSKTDDWVPLGENRSGHALEYRANQTRHVHSRKDANEHVHVVKAERIIERGTMDYLEAVVREFGDDGFIISGGVVGAFYSCVDFVGIGNLPAMLREEPDLIAHLERRILERVIEEIRALAAVGGDAIYIDESLATNDVISLSDYERFCLPYTRAMVEEIHRCGLKAIVFYWGGVSDRLHEIASTGADCLVMEATMKGFTNDIEQAVAAIGERVTLCSNIDPVGVLQNGSDEELEAEIRRQVAAGVKARGFIVTTASQITPGTPLSRVLRFMELGKRIGAEARATVR